MRRSILRSWQPQALHTHGWRRLVPPRRCPVSHLCVMTTQAGWKLHFFDALGFLDLVLQPLFSSAVTVMAAKQGRDREREVEGGRNGEVATGSGGCTRLLSAHGDWKIGAQKGARPVVLGKDADACKIPWPPQQQIGLFCPFGANPPCVLCWISCTPRRCDLLLQERAARMNA